MGEIEFQRPIGATGARLLQLCGPGDYQARSLPRGDRALSPGARRICRQLKGKKGSNYVLCDVKLAGHRVKTATSLIVTSGFGPAGMWRCSLVTIRLIALLTLCPAELQVFETRLTFTIGALTKAKEEVSSAHST